MKEEERAKQQTFRKFLGKVEDQLPRFRSFSEMLFGNTWEAGSKLKSVNRGPWAPIYRNKTPKIPQTIGNLIAPSSETTHHLAEFSKSARPISSHNKQVPRAIGFHMKEKFCKDDIFIPPFLTGPDMRYKRGHCGILPKMCHVAPSPLATRTTPLATLSIAIPPGRILHG